MQNIISGSSERTGKHVAIQFPHSHLQRERERERERVFYYIKTLTLWGNK